MKPKIKISKDDLQNLYSTKKNREICEILGITVPTLMSYLKKAGIKLKGCGNRQPKAKVDITE